VDDLGGLSQAITVASELADLGKDFEIEEFPKVRTPAEAIAELLEVRQDGISLGGTAFDNPLLQKLSDAEPILNSLNDPLGVYGILPWYRAQLGFNSWKIKL
jgi:protease-4